MRLHVLYIFVHSHASDHCWGVFMSAFTSSSLSEVPCVCACVYIRGVIVYTVCASDGDGECVLASSVFGPYPPRPVSVMGAC